MNTLYRIDRVPVLAGLIKERGLTDRLPSGNISKWQCDPVLCPVLPMRAIAEGSRC